MAAVIPFKGKEPASTGFVRPLDLPFTCTDERLLEAVQSHLLGEKPEEIARLLHIPHKALRHWTTSKGWRFLEDSLRDPVRKAVIGQTTRLVSKLVTKMEDQLEKGDPVYDMEGNEIGRRGIRFKDLSTSYAAIVTKQLELEKNLGPLRDSGDQPSVDRLIHALEAWAEKKEKVIEGERA